MMDRLAFVAPPSLVQKGVVETTDLERILALPRRPVVDCMIDSRTKRYQPETQALVEIETQKFSRGSRISCACRPRKIQLHENDWLIIFRVLPEGERPEPPIRISRTSFLADNRTSGDDIPRRAVATMLFGQEIELPAADGGVGHPCITELNPPQAWALREAAQEGGLVGFLGVGSGKTVILLLAPLLFPDSRLAVLLIEPKQRQHYKSQYQRLREHFRVTSIVGDVEIPGSTVPGTTPIHLVSYSVLSRTENSDLLDRLLPDILLPDEEHRITKNSAINRRVKRYIASRIKAREESIVRGEQVRPRAVRMIGGSGTLEDDSINNTQMICAYSLGTGSPLPLDPNEAEAWSNVYDDSHTPDRKSQTARRLHKAFGRGLVQADDMTNLFDKPEPELRRGFQKWRAETPGIVTASASDINASIYFGEFDVPKMPKAVVEALAKVRMWMRPDGDELVEKLEQVICARNVACGFFNYWSFSKHPCTCKLGVAGDSRCDECLLIDDWYAKRKAFNKALRSRILLGDVQLDSRKLCEDAAKRAWAGSEVKDVEAYCSDCLDERTVAWPCLISGHKPAWRTEAWPDWCEVENKVEYEERVRWVGHDLPEAKDSATHPGYFLARAAADWALKNRGIVWFQSTPLGRKIEELSGLPYFNGGLGCEERLRAEKGDRSIICSIPALASGTDGLQNLFCDQIIVEVPASNAKQRGVEQLLGRLHRRGQRSDLVSAWAAVHVSECMDALRHAIRQAEFNHQSTKILPKILMADLDIEDL